MPKVSVAVRIQHHPSREELLPGLIAALDPLLVQVSTHSSEPPSPMAGYLQALSDLPPTATHVLVIQDDAVPCRNFAATLERVLVHHSDGLVCLFLARLPGQAAKAATRAMQKRQSFIGLHERKIVPVVATVWPVGMARDFQEWAKSARLAGTGRSDDGSVAQWASGRHRKRVYATVPSIVQHPDMCESTIGRRAHWGKDKNRVALYFIEDGDEWGMS